MARKDFADAMGEAFRGREQMKEPVPEEVPKKQPEIVKEKELDIIENPYKTVIRTKSKQKGRARSLYIREDTYDKLYSLSKRSGRSVSEVVQAILDIALPNITLDK